MGHPTEGRDTTVVGMPRAVAVFGPAIDASAANRELRRYVRFLMRLLVPAFKQLLPNERAEILEQFRRATAKS